MAENRENSSLEGIIAAYQDLDEKTRRGFCLGLQKYCPELFKEWFLMAGFGKGGFQVHKVAARNTDFDRRQLDLVIYEKKSGDLLRKLILGHFFNADEVSKAVVRKQADILKGRSPLNTFIELMNTKEKEISMSSVYRLYEQLYKVIDLDSIEKVSHVSHCENPFNRIRNDLNELDEKVTEIIDLLRPLAFCGAFDDEKVATLVNDAISRSEYIVKSIDQLDDEHLFEEGRFANREDFNDYLNKLEQRIDARRKRRNQQKQKRILDLVEVFTCIGVKHRSEKQSRILESYLETAMNDLQSLAENPLDFEFPGPDACDWLEWALTLDGKKLETIQNELQNLSASLSDFIGLCEFGWLLKKESKKGEPENNCLNSKEGYFENTDSLVEKGQGHSGNGEKQPYAQEIEEPILREKTNEQSEHLKKLPSSDEHDGTQNVADTFGSLPSEPTDKTIDVNGKQAEPPVVEGSEKSTKNEFEVPATTDVQIKDEKPRKTSTEAPIEKGCKKQKTELNYQNILDSLDNLKIAKGGEFIVQQLDEVVLDLFEKCEFPIAYHVSRLTEDLLEVSDDRFPAWAVSALVLGSNFTPGMDDLTLPFQGSIAHHNRKIFRKDTAWTQGLSLMLAAATFRPALFAPISGAQSVLHELRFGELSEVASIADAIVQFANRGMPLPRAALRKAWTITEWQKESERLINETRSWLSQAGNFAIISRPGKSVWRHWISEDGHVHAILDPIIRQDEKNVKAMKEKIARWPEEIENDAKTTHSRTLGHRGDLLRPALRQIHRRAQEAIGFAKRWIYLTQNNVFSEGSHNEKQAVALRQSLDIHYEPALAELREIESSGAPKPYIAGAAICFKSLSNLYSLLNNLEENPESSFNADRLLNEDLLRVSEITLDENWIPEEKPEEQLSALIHQLAEGLPDFEKAFEIQCRQESHEATERIVQALGKGNAENTLIEEMERKRDKLINQQRAALLRGIQQSQRQLSEGLNKGLLQDLEYERWSAKLSAAEHNLKSQEAGFLRFFEVRRIFESVSSQLETMKENEAKRILESFSELVATEEQKQRVDKVLKQGDIYTANDYLERLRSGKELPDLEATPSGRAFLDLFDASSGSSQFSTIEKALADQKPPETIEAIKSGRGFQGVSMKSVPGTQARQSGKMLETWFLVKRARRITAEQAGEILAGLGFNPINIKLSSTGQRTWIELKAQPVFECPVSEYGSSVGGVYQFLCEWGITNEEDLLGAFSNSFHGAARIVFYFGRMTETRRRDLGKLCRKHHQTVIVLDDTLLINLCSFRGSKLRIFYECSLPFTYLSPYSVTSSLLPPEMFYGRRRQIEALISDQPNGSCILYGGRQIGKTVLLRHVERIFQNHEMGFEAKFIDLKVKGIGTSRSLDDLWVVLTQELAESDIIQAKVPAQASSDWLFDQIETWLNESSGRRILLLLDEADVFLESDGRDTSKGREPFSRCALIRGTMEKTNRRFKVVFSGLHNVQRSTEVANNPLAQFGETICIGPMLANGESLEAERLITKPLSSLGYFFESSDLVARILAHTNYYPNLIQIYCHNLLAHLVDNGEGLFDRRSTPPFIITSSMIDDVYERHDLRESISDKFKLTLNLDLRFRLIAHILAYYDENSDDGFDVDWIKNEALEFWPAGFRTGRDEGCTLSYDAFKNLLNEMVGLGILRRTAKRGYYALRSPNVVNLLGHRNQIEGVLVEAESWEPVGEYEPATFHALLDNSDTVIRSPLTAVQEAALKSKENQIFLLHGNRAGGLDDVHAAISHRFGQEYVYDIEDADSSQSFEEKLQTLVSRPREGTSVVYIPPQAPWNGEWIRVAMKKAQRLRLPEATVTFLFVSDPLKSWQIIQEKEISERNARLIQLEPWSDGALRQWLEDGPFGPQQPDVRTQIRGATGNWPYLLYQLAKGATTRAHLSDELPEFVNNRKVKTEFRKELADAFGLNIAEPVEVLRTMAIYGDDLTQEDISVVIENVRSSEKEGLVDRALKWAQALNLADQTGISAGNSLRKRPTWRLNPVVHDLLIPSI